MTASTQLARVQVLAKGWRLTSVAAGWLGLLVVLTALPSVVTLPQSSTLPISAPTMGFASWWCAALAMHSASEPSHEIFATAPRLPHIYNLARVLAIVSLGTTVTLWVEGTEYTSVAYVSSAALMGEFLLAAGVLGVPYAWVVPTLHLAASAVLGGANRVQLAGWAWVLERSPSNNDSALSTLILATGLVVWWRAGRIGPTIGKGS